MGEWGLLKRRNVRVAWNNSTPLCDPDSAIDLVVTVFCGFLSNLKGREESKKRLFNAELNKGTGYF